jgi:hypothetical protein
MSTEAMAARVRAAGHSIIKDPKSSNTNCILHGKRADNGDTWTTSFSIEDAKRAGIFTDGGTWAKYPDVMCYNRAMSKMFRQMTPDLSKGAGYTLDELKEIAESRSDFEPASVPKAEIVTQEQADDLASVLVECDPAYVVRVWQALRRGPDKVENLNQLTVELYERVKMAALKNREDHQAKISVQEVEDFDLSEEEILEEAEAV